jgi:hypothetical protein
MTEWDGPDMRETGVDTPGCDCGHDGMALGWHLQGCAWRDAMEAQEWWERDRWGRLNEAQRDFVAALRESMSRLFGKGQR